MTLATDILLVRHGQTLWNRARRVQGRLDSPLTALGEEQAATTGAWLAGLGPFERVLVSPLGRARQTAAIIAAATGQPPQVDERLAERCMGALQGLSQAQIEAQHPDFREQRAADGWHAAPPDGESHADVALRVAPVLEELRAQGGRHLVISHGIVTRVLVALAAGLTPADGVRVRCPNDLVYRVRQGEGAVRLGHVRGGGAEAEGWFAG